MNEKKSIAPPINKDLADLIRKKFPTDDDVYLLSEFFKVMGDGTRLKILIALIHNEFCVGDIAYMLNMSQSAVSHQLRVLKNAKLVRSRRDGRMIYYSLDDDHIKDILDESMTHVLDCE